MGLSRVSRLALIIDMLKRQRVRPVPLATNALRLSCEGAARRLPQIGSLVSSKRGLVGGS